MEQRPLRLGDIVDDYCPRERRLTNHAIVAIVEETVKQTRCTTCDHEHVFKNAREPRKRKKDEPAALYAQVLSGLQKDAGHVADARHADAMAEAGDDAMSETGGEQVMEADDTQDEPATVVAHTNDDGAAAHVEASSDAAEAGVEALDAPDADEAQPGNETEPGNEIWPMHRRLIRAQLPRTGNEPPPARPLPEFTIRQPGSRNGGRQWGRGGGGNPNGNGNGNGNHAGRGGQGAGGGGQRPGRGGRFAPPRPDGPRGGPGGRPGGGRGRRSR